ncbi:Asp-tRNA(Asn)/Glu-tRNA(Gln) amidotransferase subunit GatC [Curtobacterium aetherium]|uniref:Asp-tRNA(Asn)/Glu-tRNA(Gln) amidotransferase subunit GatC n=1 Tax=Curtobacterium aetherium TaxID=2841594 RepID=A0ACD1E0G1_9MICO|nr:Asp-tRNA(Asn)/Glu-tRNA(Gln) amidotransferase subunit GatC [Curtobacterium sp. L6-1]QWS32381.1 Asp-tRNA(Asn)/Glu-tRNA(Gln) amidotransferase subunit GatC [Curtobacterium sp. L6-1]
MPDITSEQVAYLANLARIALTPDEIEKMTEELSLIVDSVAKVTEVATPDVPATSHPVPLENVSRPDEVGETLTQEQALSGAPDSDGERFRVTAILGEEQ